IPSGTSGSVLTHTKGIDGVMATGEEYWWYVDIGGNQGWIQESAVTPSLMNLTQEEPKFEKKSP
ncbi:MAG: hypothetical protein GWO10_26835, partial [candidate division Zixibacteria bacterium]|nr:hypothetical protein [candidate division Zixibacteria bacterium]